MFEAYRNIAAAVKQHLPAIRWVDIDKGQLDNPEAFHSILVPGLLVDISQIAWDGQSRGAQFGSSLLTSRLVFRLPISSYQENGTDHSPLDNYDEIDILSRQLHELLDVQQGIGDRRNSRIYFTAEYLIVEQGYDLIVRYDKPIKTTPKPGPTIQVHITPTIKIR